jgi:tRNA A37 threonylcarbamoyladenosine dehydratase
MSDLGWLSRSELLIGKENIQKLQQSHVLVVGLGGVGSFAAEFICRAGVGEMTIVDGDVVDPTNRNRQLPALFTTHGVSKAGWMKDRLLAINPDLKLHVIDEFLSPERCEELLRNEYDYVMDCIDSITPKLTLIAAAYKSGKKVVSSMGAGGKTDPTQIRVADLYETHTCKLAFYVRKRLKKMEVFKGVRAVYSLEEMDKDQRNEFQFLLEKENVSQEEIKDFVIRTLPNSDDLIREEIEEFLKDANNIMDQIKI